MPAFGVFGELGLTEAAGIRGRARGGPTTHGSPQTTEALRLVLLLDGQSRFKVQGFVVWWNRRYLLQLKWPVRFGSLGYSVLAYACQFPALTTAITISHQREGVLMVRGARGTHHATNERTRETHRATNERGSPLSFFFKAIARAHPPGGGPPRRRVTELNAARARRLRVLVFACGGIIHSADATRTTSQLRLKAPPVEHFLWLPVGVNSAKPAHSSVWLI